MKLVVSNGCSICTAVKRILTANNIKCEYLSPQDAEGSQIVSESGMRELPVLELDGDYYSGMNVLKKVKTMKGE